MVIRITWKEKGELETKLPETIPTEASQPAEGTETQLHSTPTDNQQDTMKCETAATRQHQMMQRLIPFFGQNYRFRYNVLTEQAEFAEADSDSFRPVTQRAMNAICMNAFSHDVECWNKDIRSDAGHDLLCPYPTVANSGGKGAYTLWQRVLGEGADLRLSR